MSRFHSYLNTAQHLIETYHGEKPFAVFIKQFFAVEKKFGARDRRQIASLCYNFFRLGFAAESLPVQGKLLLGNFLCENQPSELLERLNPGYNNNISLSIADKLIFTANEFALSDILPFTNHLSKSIDSTAYCQSFLVQPDVFLRIRPHTKITALKKLKRSKLPYESPGTDIVQLPPGTCVDNHFLIDKEVVIQDYNSQQVLNYLKQASVQNSFKNAHSKTGITAWDCCAASGGKSILLTDILHNKTDLTVSDIRPAIILNLHHRFIKAGIKAYRYFIADVSTADSIPVDSSFELIICDAPCTGSGTWSRTPEQLCHFKLDDVEVYSQLQMKIVTHVLPYLQPGGLFIYITCSVFAAENEGMVSFITNNFECQLMEQQVLKGYDKKADSMFVAVFKKPGSL